MKRRVSIRTPRHFICPTRFIPGRDYENWGIGWAGEKISGTGQVYKLKDIADFPGKYSELRGGAAAAKSAGGLYLSNDKSVEISVKTHTEGLAMSIGVTGVTIQMAMVSDVVKRDIPMLGYTVPYAVNGTLMAMLGMVILMIY